MNDEKKSFDYMWELLNPPREFHNMRSKCETALWNNLSIHMQHRVYRLIRDRKRRGESIHPNPWYAIVPRQDDENGRRVVQRTGRHLHPRRSPCA